jgi:hypothetical protein
MTDNDGRSAALDEDFWQARHQFASIRSVAHQRMVGPWAVLGAVLAMVCSRVGPHVVLPAIVGGRGSLNVFVGLVGPSGAGKDAATSVARELLRLNDNVPTKEVGTGQGIDAIFVEHTKQGPMQMCDAALLTLTEIDTLAAHASMGGANILPTLRKVFTGAALGAQYADRTKRRPVGDHRYRAALIAGIQPARSGVLLDDRDGGTPQRWLWLPVNDPLATTPAFTESFESALGPLWVGGDWHAPIGDTEGLTAVGPKSFHEFHVCHAAVQTIQAQRFERLTAAISAAPEADGLNGHALLTRLKVAALLAILCRGDDKVDDEDWALAGRIMQVSDETRQLCAATLTETTRRANTARAHLEADRAEMIAEKRVADAARAIWRRMTADWRTPGDLRREINSRHREDFDAAMAKLIGAGVVQRKQEPEWSGEVREMFRRTTK